MITVARHPKFIGEAQVLLIALEIFWGGGDDKKLKVFKFTVSNFQHLERPVLGNFKAIVN